MQSYSLSHVRDAELLRDLAGLVAQDRATTATLLAHIAEVDVRRLYVPAGYPSMHAYCVDELRLSEDAAKRRIQAARAARQFPTIFHELAEGRLHLTGVCLIAPHLSMENARALIGSASNKRKIEIEELLARHFQLPEGRVRSITPVHSEIQQPASAQSGDEPATEGSTLGEGALAHLPELQNVTPAATPERSLLQIIIAKTTSEKLRHAQDLLSHAVPRGDVAQVLDRALDALIVQLEKRKFGGAKTRHSQQRTTAVRMRCIPSHIRRAVWERDHGQCAFVSADGTRCKARKLLEFDHIEPVGRGGQATVANMRLRCRAHNQYEAERAFGSDFMRRKRQEARVAAAESRSRLAAEARARAVKERLQEIVAGLRNLGCRSDEARRAAEFSMTLEHATLEERMRAALKFLSRGVPT
jgi:hypothetical protein